MGILDLLDDLDVVQLDVEVLIDALERAPDLDVILELDCHLMVDERLEETAGFWFVSLASVSFLSFLDSIACCVGSKSHHSGIHWHMRR
jgi:hypothetical protein